MLSSCAQCMPGILELCYHSYPLPTTKMTVPYGMCYPIVQCGVEIPNRVFVGGLPYNVSLHRDPLHVACCMLLLHSEWWCTVHTEQGKLCQVCGSAYTNYHNVADMQIVDCIFNFIMS